MDAVDPISTSRQLELVATGWRRWRRALVAGEGLDREPFAGVRELTGRAAYDSVAAMHESDPLRVPLLGWIQRLMEQRINQVAICAVTSELRIERRVVERPEHTELTLAEMLRRALAEPARRAPWLSTYLERTSPLSAAVSLLWERRAEIARRLGHDHFDALDPSAAEIVRAAEEWLDATDDLAGEWRTHDFATLITTSLGSDADAGWPGRLAVRTLADWFRDTRLLSDLDFDLGRLPRPIAGSSFVRALARFGAAFADAARPRGVPFVIACDPRGLGRARTGALFAGLGLNPQFVRRKLELSSGAARDHARVIGRVMLLHSRAQALRVGLRVAALGGRASFENAFEERVERRFGVSLPKTAAGAVFRLRVDDAQRFAGLLLAAHDSERLLEEHDEDWFRNPRAVERLRAELALSPEIGTSREALAAGAKACLSALREALG